MINEIAFVNHHSSIWNTLLPGCDLFVRRMNFDLCIRADTPLLSHVEPSRRGFINEVAFSIYCDSMEARNRPYLFDLQAAEVRDAISSAKRKIANLEHVQEENHAELASHEIMDVKHQIARFRNKISVEPDHCRPAFPGCGILDKCFGDVLHSRVLYEIKAGDRPFRSVDVRQILVYLSVNSYSSSYDIEEACLYNPRSGLFFKSDIDRFAYEASGKRFRQIAYEIIEAISAGEISQ